MRFWLIITLFSILSCVNEKDTLKVACAANMEAALDSIATVYEQENNIKIDVIAASSIVLAMQIEQGADYDVFIAANTLIPQDLYKKGIVSTPKVLVNAKLYLIYDSHFEFDNELDLLTANDIEKIAIPDPELAPFGAAAVDHLSSMNILKDIDYKVVYAEDVAHTNNYLQTG